MNKKLLLWVFVLFLIPIGTNAQDPAYIFEQEDDIDLRISCFDTNDLPCDDGTTCLLTIFYPDSSVLIENQTMNREATYYNYSLNSSQTSINGEYSSIVYCAGTTNDYTSFVYKITPSGEDPTEAQSILYIGLFVMILVLLVVSIATLLNIKNVYGKFTLLCVIYILFFALSFVGWNIADQFLTSATTLTAVLWVIFMVFRAMLIPFVLGLFLWIFFELRKIEVIKNMLERGIPEDEAYARTLKKGRGFK